jgi:hypothetical protein
MLLLRTTGFHEVNSAWQDEFLCRTAHAPWRSRTPPPPPPHRPEQLTPLLWGRCRLVAAAADHSDDRGRSSRPPRRPPALSWPWVWPQAWYLATSAPSRSHRRPVGAGTKDRKLWRYRDRDNSNDENEVKRPL